MSPQEAVALDGRVSNLLGLAARYKLLATAFARPELSTLADLKGHWPDAEGDSEALSRPLGAFREACAGAELSSLQEEYPALFSRKVLCPPYESCYGWRPGGPPVLLAGISGFYGAFGLEPSRAHPEVPDHIAVELEFMSALCLKEAYALFHGLAEPQRVMREARRAFLGAHLGRWADAFADGLEVRAVSPFFRAAAALLRAFLAEERCRLEGAAVTGKAVSPTGAPR